MGAEQTHDNLVSQAVTKYNSIVKQGLWKQVEPKDAIIVALTTRINNLESTIRNGGTSAAESGSTILLVPRPESNFTLEDWRIVSDGKDKVVDNLTWYWCPNHEMEVVYDAMYVKHSEDKYDKWIERKKGRKKKKDNTTSRNPSSTTTPTSQKLTLNNNLKATMVTNFNCTEAEANNLWVDVVQNSAVN